MPSKIPKNCPECFRLDEYRNDGENWIPSPYKKDTPYCPFERWVTTKESLETLREVYNIDLRVDLETLAYELKMEGEKCLSELPKRAENIRYEAMFNAVSDRLEEMRESNEKLKEEIFNRLKKQTSPILQKAVEIDDIKKSVKKSKPSLLQNRGFKYDQRNIKARNVTKYLLKLAEKKPELEEEVHKVINGEESEYIRLANNKRRNKMIMYREMAENVTI
ncbi:MAG: hypothetical protein U9M89_00575 [Patescibacteria group bacterium]|nr:hypothetical protein [Patescibacteria group bacterium]